MTFWIGLIALALLGVAALTKPGMGRAWSMLLISLLLCAGWWLDVVIRSAAHPEDAEAADLAEMQAELRAMFIRPGTISLRDPETLAVRDDVSAAIRQHLDADTCRYFLDGDYSAFDWAANIALEIDGMPAEVEPQ